MASYRITWEIDVEADSPYEAAKEAKKIQQDPESTANVFVVEEEGSDPYTYDLDDGYDPYGEPE